VQSSKTFEEFVQTNALLRVGVALDGTLTEFFSQKEEQLISLREVGFPWSSRFPLE